MANDDKKTKKPASASINDLLSSLKATWHKIEPHVGFLYTVILLLGITYAVYTVSQTLQTKNLSEGAPSGTGDFSTRFDETTIQKIRSLSENDTPSDIQLPSGRINPFSE